MKKIISLLTDLTVITSANTPLSQVVATGDTLSESVYNIKGFKSRNADFVITTIKDGIETVRNKENNFLKIQQSENINKGIDVEADSMEISCLSWGQTSLNITGKGIFVELELSAGDSTYTFDGKSHSLKGNYYKEYISPVNSEEKDFFRYCDNISELTFYGRITDGLYFEPTKDGFLLDAVNGVGFINNNEELGKIYISEKTEVRFSRNRITGFYIDFDKDGIYEHRVESGDVNCDGKIDSIDASLVLEAYSAASTGRSAFVNDTLADFDRNGVVNSSDSSLILEHYAENQTV